MLYYDVAIVGGGTAGVFAAISSAKTGAKTVLIEKNSVLGGTVTVGGVNFPGLFFAWGKQIIDGPCWEAVERTVKLEGAKLPEITFKPRHHWDEQILLNKFIYTGVLFDMCEEAGVDILCNAMIAEAAEKSDGVLLTVCLKEGLRKIRCKAAVDATGDANLSVIAGFEVEKSKTAQPATPQNHITNYNINNVSEKEIEEKYKTACFPEYITPQKLFGWLKRNIIDIHIPCENADTSEGRTALEKRTYKDILSVYKFYRSVTGLENIEIDIMPCETGVRESNRIKGIKTVTAEDYITGYSYNDSVCYAFYPIDLHVMNGIEQRFFEENVVAKVPYAALVPKDSKKILCAGRCISSDPYANSGLRVEAVCMATGQAAGCGAALAAISDCDVGNVEYEKIKTALKKINAIVP